LIAYLSEVSQDLIDQTLDMFDKLITELMTKGKNRQKEHFKVVTTGVIRNSAGYYITT